MNIFSGDFSALVFKGLVKANLDEFSIDTQMLKVLTHLDGRKNLASVSRAINMDMKILQEVLTRLYSVNLIVKVDKSVPMLNKEFFNFLVAQLSFALGPIAEFLIEEEIREFGDDPAKVLPRKEKRVAFQQAMVLKIKETSP
ncbi:MAG: hypothetical protein JRF40_15050 [Deltaproteobacteria bacterium]|nr:hypothetical protein [Deltaproteobacteria bacterium]